MIIKYRPEIDGLRALAIFFVISYHSKLNFNGNFFFEGGFLGVDIFFVISGYLIGKILLNEFERFGTINLKNFYEKRFRRIFPALLFTIFITTLLSIFILIPEQLVEFSKSFFASLVFYSNFFFYFIGQEYGAGSSLIKPLIHTWSLSVEEQFYILFPLTLLIIYRFFKYKIDMIFIVIFLLSLFYAEYLSKFNNSLNFYIIFSRVWELFAGVIVANFEKKFYKKKISPFLSNFFCLIGFIFIIYSVLLFDENTKHPSLLTIYPILGTCVLILFANSPKNLFKKIFSIKIFVNIGLISYSLYLFHQPLFALARLSGLVDSSFKKTLLVAFLFLMSLISYNLVEKPFRSFNFALKKVLLIILLPLTLIITLNFWIIFEKGFIKKYPALLTRIQKTNTYRIHKQNDISCHDRIGDKGFCVYGEGADKNIVLIGDSISDSILGNFIEKVYDDNFKLIHMSYSGNFYLPGFQVYDKTNNRVTQSLEKHNYRKEFLDKLENDTFIVLIANYSLLLERRLRFDDNNNIEFYNTNNKYIKKGDNPNLIYIDRKKKLKQQIKDSIIELTKKFKVILVYPLPQPPAHVSAWINSKRLMIENDENYYEKDVLNYNKEIYLNLNKEIFELFDGINVSNLHKIYPEDIFCDNSKCYFYDNENSYFFDTVHLSYYGGEILSSEIINITKNAR